MHKIISRMIIILAFFSILQARENIKIKGRVVDENKNPLEYANVYVIGTLSGAASKSDGSFQFIFADTLKKGTLIASMIGYKKSEITFSVDGRKELEFEIILESEAYKLSEAVITGSSFSSVKGKGIVVTAMDVLTTPGGAADIFQSLKTMPGMIQVSESAQLFIRGGDPKEALTIVDQATINHPFTNESSYGGLFSNINTGSIKGMYFSSGGFSAKYGNALSGVLDIQTQDEPLVTQFNIGLSFASAQLGASIPIINEKLGVRITGRHNFTRPLMWLNNTLDKFESTPISRDLATSLTYKYSQSGRIKLWGIFAGDKQGVNVQRAEFDGVFTGSSNSSFLNIQQSDIIGENIFIKNSLSYIKYVNTQKYGLMNLELDDLSVKFASDAEYQINSKNKLSFGLIFQNHLTDYTGTIPKNEYDIRPGGESDKISSGFEGKRYGAYAEIENFEPLNIKNSFISFGIRGDVFPEKSISWVDPRISFGLKLNEKSTLKFGSGIFHQIPNEQLFNGQTGNPDLKSMFAYHFILSYDYNPDETTNLRVEAYHKTYENLPLEEELLNYNNNGNGYAYGVDFIAKGELIDNLEGWVSYGFINTKRKWMDFAELTSSNFDITHNLSVILKYNITPIWQLGINYKYATGQPFTPVKGAVYINEYKIYKPIDGAKNSERYPNFQRLDFRILHYTQIFNNTFAAVYLEALNILNIENLFGYKYNADYTKKEIIPSYFGNRTIVLGVSLTF